MPGGFSVDSPIMDIDQRAIGDHTALHLASSQLPQIQGTPPMDIDQATQQIPKPIAFGQQTISHFFSIKPPITPRSTDVLPADQVQYDPTPVQHPPAPIFHFTPATQELTASATPASDVSGKHRRIQVPLPLTSQTARQAPPRDQRTSPAEIMQAVRRRHSEVDEANRSPELSALVSTCVSRSGPRS